MSLREESAELVAHFESEVAQLQAEISHLNAAVYLQKSKSLHGRGESMHEKSSHHLQSDVGSCNYPLDDGSAAAHSVSADFCAFLRRRRARSGPMTVSQSQSQSLESKSTSDEQSSILRPLRLVMTAERIQWEILSCMRRFTSSLPNQKLIQLFGKCDVEDKFKVADGTLHAEFTGALLEDVKYSPHTSSMNSFFCSRLFYHFLEKFEDCGKAKQATEDLLLSCIHLVDSNSIADGYFTRILVELLGKEASRRSFLRPSLQIDEYSLDRPSQREFRQFLFLEIFKESFKTLQVP